MNYYNNTELYHHGIKGQKWGVRRFQNEDGSLTSKGKKRQKIMEEASDKAKRFIGYANENIKDYTKNRDNENIRISKRQIKRYKKLYDKYSNMDVATISKKDLKEAKKFVKKAIFNDAHLTWTSDHDNYEDHD